MTEQLTGTQIQDARAALAIQVAHAEKALAYNIDHVEGLAMNEQIDKDAAFQERVTSDEARDLNDAAEVAIWGSRGLTDGFVDAAGNPLTKPLKGKVDEIRENPRFGTKLADRETAATAYEKELLGLVDKGYELTQAKLIMDLRETDVDSKAHLIASYISQGIPAGQAKAKANKTYKRKDKQRLEVIKSEGILSQEDYDNRNQNTGSAKTPEATVEGYRFPGQRDRIHDPNAKGDRQLSAFMHEPGTTLELDKHDATKNPIDRKMIVTDVNGKEYLVQSGSVYDILASLKLGRSVKVPVDGELPDITIGQPWILSAGSGGLEKVDYVEVATGKVKDGTNVEGVEDGGEDPFEGIILELRDLNRAYRKNQEAESKKIRNRVRSRMNQAHISWMNASKKERYGLAGAVVGLIALGAAAYAGNKGVDVTPHLQDGHQNAKDLATSIDVPTPKGSSSVIDQVGNALDNVDAPKPPHPEHLHLQHLVVGDTNPWTISEHNLHELGYTHPSPAQIEHYDKLMADLNPDKYHYDGDSSRFIPDGTRLALPDYPRAK